MDEQQNVSHERAGNLCTKGCGFFGSSAFSGMCSQCFKSTSQNAAPSQAPPAGATLGKSDAKETSKQEEPGLNDNSGTRPEDDGPFKSEQPSSSGSSSTDDSSKSTAKVKGGDDAQSDDVAPAVDENIAPRVKRSKTDLEKESPEEVVEDGENGGQDSSSDSRPGSANKKISRCKECRRKVGLTGYQCRCGGTFCGAHRYSDVHKCDFDYKQMGTEEIRKNNPVVKGDKIRKL